MWPFKSKKKVFCVDCKHFVSSRTKLLDGTCYHPQNLVINYITKTKEIKLISFHERHNAKGNCPYYEAKKS